eukprot:scaffold19656_cov22-Prasinocladus_malaysianus.AAC.1
MYPSKLPLMPQEFRHDESSIDQPPWQALLRAYVTRDMMRRWREGSHIVQSAIREYSDVRAELFV